MTVFAAALRAIFTDPNMAEEAVYTPSGGDPVTVRVIRRAPTESYGFGETQISSSGVTFEVRRSEVASPKANDTITAAGQTRVIQGEPELDDDELVWTLNTRPAS